MATRKDREAEEAEQVQAAALAVIAERGEVCALDLAVQHQLHPAAVYRILARCPAVRAMRFLWWVAA